MESQTVCTVSVTDNPRYPVHEKPEEDNSLK